LQRISAILMLALFSFALVAPVLPADSEATLPPCCRRDGKHHCGMKMKTEPLSSGVALRASMRCSMFGKAGVMPVTAKAITVAPVEFVGILLASHPTAVAQTEARYRVSFSRSRQKRGPPSFLS
jgi:hypothetical protein